MNEQNVYTQVVTNIIQQQETIIGPIAVERAKQVSGLKIDWSGARTVSFSGDPKLIIDHLVEQYKELFGQISVDVCIEAAAPLISQLTTEQTPSILRR